MTNETRNRIEAYKRALPEMKERVAAAAFLMVMSVMMMVSASFAWITLSRAPEAAGMQTTVAANGNLEIALAQGPTVDETGKKANAVVPGESQAGDSSAAEGQSIVEANATWGNLLNVSDPSYGISNIALRPALLSAYNRTEYPLNGATYGGDGRVVSTNDRYEFASYEKIDDSHSSFLGGNKVNYGVRAISTVKYENVTGNARIDNYRNDTNQFYMDAQNYYGQIVSDESNSVNTLDEAGKVTCITTLQGLVTAFAQDEVNSMGLGNGKETKTSCSPHLWYLYQMILLLENVLEMEGKAILEMANWQAYIASGDDKIETTYEKLEDLLDDDTAELKSKGVNISTLASYKQSLSDISFCINGLKDKAEKCKNPDAPEETYYFDDIKEYVNRLVNINTTTMNGVELGKVNSKNAFDLLKDGDVIVKSGALVDIEKRLVNNQNRVQANVAVTVSVIILGSETVNGTVYTAAYGKEPTYSTDIAFSDSQISSAKGEATAKDTYGMALDVWVRTNYPDAVLTLEGSAKYEEERDSIVIEGTKYDLYTISVGEGDTQTERDVYKKGEDWYYANTMEKVLDMEEKIPKEKYVPVIVGYEGENRIWEDWRELLEAGYIEQDATTQGAGSCFVFYADTPTEQVKIMEMLEAFNVAFMDQNGAVLGTAKLNLDSAYANQGKVTVPLEVETGTDYTDESGMSHKGITRLEQNTPTMITAIVYLNGSKVKNENVLADGELQGQLNIQFGTDCSLVAPDNVELQAQSRSITATVTVGGETISDGTIGGTEGLEYKADGYTATVELTVEGEQPERISGYFVRVINSTQGSRCEVVDFTKNSDGKWSADFNLKNPGTYAFNTLIVDGVQYTLHDGTEQSGMNTYYPSNRPYVYIQGLKVTSASVGVTPGTYMTADSSKIFPVTAKVEAAVEPKNVSAQFFSMDEKNPKQYTALLNYDSVNKEWKGSANISSSGVYTLKYIVVDGIPIEVPSTGMYTLYLGLTARVSTTLADSEWAFPYIGATQITMITRIYDDTGEQIKNLSNVKLRYNNVASPASMSWNDAGYYIGVFDIIQPGELTFKSLELGTVGTIYNVSTSPTFWAMSMERPVYESVSASSLQTVIKNTLDAKITATMRYAETASVYAVVEHKVKDTDPVTTYYVPASEPGNSLTFVLPKLDGKWTIKQLWLQNVYDPDYEDANGNKVGKWYAKPSSGTTEKPTYTKVAPEGEHFVFNTEELTTDVVATYQVTLSYDGVIRTAAFPISFGDISTAEFMTSYYSKELNVKVCDYQERAINADVSVNWKIEHDESLMDDYGGYTGDEIKIEPVLTLKEGSTTIYKADPQEFRVAGRYTSTITVDLGKQGKRDLVEVPTFEVRSKTPELTIYSFSPQGKHTTVNQNNENQDVESKKEGNIITIYSKSRVEVSGCNKNGVLEEEPKVTLKLTGLGNAKSASLVFKEENNGEVRLYSGENSKNGKQTNAYMWDSTTGENVSRFVGYNDAGSCDQSKVAGKLISENIVTMEYETETGIETYAVAVDAITIINNKP